MRAPDATCTICSRPCTSPAPDGPPVCGALRCRFADEATPAHLRCIVCGAVLEARDAAGRACPGDCTRRAFLGRSPQQRREARDALLVRQQEALRGALRGRGRAIAGWFASRGADAVALAQIPSFRARLTPVARRRRAALERRVRSLAEAARGSDVPLPERAAEEQAPDPRPAVSAVLARSCAHCGGNCCRGGDDHAHVSVDTVRHWLVRHPEASDDDVVAAYAAHVPRTVMHGSCIFHTRVGCALPRTMRSDTCNRYLCPSLRELRDTLTTAGHGAAFVSSVHHGQLGDSILMDGEQVRLVRLTRRSGAPPSDGHLAHLAP